MSEPTKIDEVILNVVYSGPEKLYQYGPAWIPVGKPFPMLLRDAANIVKAYPEAFAFETPDAALAMIKEVADDQKKREEAALVEITASEAKKTEAAKVAADPKAAEAARQAVRQALGEE